MIDMSNTLIPIPLGLPAVVAVDGSRHSVHAAVWAAEEAIDRDTWLRMVYVEPGADAESADARAAFDSALDAIEAAGRKIRTERQIRQGEPASAVIEESRAAQLVCVGAKGIEGSPGGRGAIAAQIAESAFCPVIIVRRRGRRHSPGDRWVIAVLDESPVAPAVWRAALTEARRRDAAALALTSWPSQSYGHHHCGDGLRAQLDHDLQACRDDDAHTRVWATSIPAHLAGALAQTADLDQLIVVGKSNPELIAELVGPQGRSLLRKTNCSVMVVRDDQCEALAAS